MDKLNINGIGMTSQRTRDRLIDQLIVKGIGNEEVIRTLRKLPRHLFMDEALANRAYEDEALPIGHGQTISQPYIVARMTELLIEEGIPEHVLEVGTGSGYQAAVLGALVKELHTVERIEPLYRNTRNLLYDLGYRNIRTHLSDGSWGWAQAAPYEAIIVTAAPDTIPQSLLDQLIVGGRLVIPVGGQNNSQQLQRITKIADDNYEIENLDEVLFVPLVLN
ncbi:MAG TPA: protein-L-isoaspartate(D-aspartate) O-methyltransferase [Thiotrichaceae bacterium]|nr:protein-L-isoaspartate(D-aspartate) O-methyltransferase [Thiotrichaceae bacterium]